MIRHVHLPLPSAHPAPGTLTGNCGSAPGVACRLVWDVSHNARAAQLTNDFLAGPVHLMLKLVYVVALALIIRAVLHRLINRITERATGTLLPQLRRPLPVVLTLAPRAAGRHWWSRRPASPAGHSPADDSAAGADGPANPQQTAAVAVSVEHAMVTERRQQRVRALGQILRSAASVTIFAIAGVVILGDLGINLAPLLASAGVVGIAIGFGAQNLVADYLTGIFMLLEDQYGVGDMVTVGTVTGTVETMTLRITRLRDVNGVAWHIRNGQMSQVGNKSQGWARAVIDFPVPYTADLAAIAAILEGVAGTAWADPALQGVILEKPEVWGAQEVTSAVVTMRMAARTAPLRQWEVEREMRARVKAALDAAGIPPSA